MTELRNLKVTAIGSTNANGIDSSTQSLNTIMYEHHEIHDGSHYNIRGFASGLTSGVSLNFGLTTPNTSKWTHLVFEITGTNQTELRGWEGATLSGGTAVTSMNNNRNSTNTYGGTIVSNPVISGSSPTSGTLIEAHSQGLIGTPPSKAEQNGTADREDEWILKSGTTYLWEIKAAGANIVDYAARFYEHTDKVQQW